MLLIDGVKYKLWSPEKEIGEFEEIVREHIKDIFGEDSIFFEKRKMQSVGGIGSIPDGFVIKVSEKPVWYIVEVEISKHRSTAIVKQMSDFITGFRSDKTRRKVLKTIYERIQKDLAKEFSMKRYIKGDVHRFLSELILEKDPISVIIIDEKTKDLEERCDTLSPSPRIVEFKTFERENTGIKVHAHLFEPIYKFTPSIPREKDVEIEGKGLEIYKVYKEKRYTAIYYNSKKIVYNGQAYPSPSKVGSVIRGGKSTNGWLFWKYKDLVTGDEFLLDELRKKQVRIPVRVSQRPQETIIIKNKIEMRLTQSSIQYTQLFLHKTKGHHPFFPDPRESFILELDNEEINTYVEEYASRGSKYRRIRKNLSRWFDSHRNLEPGNRLIITAIDPKKRYRLEITK